MQNEFSCLDFHKNKKLSRLCEKFVEIEHSEQEAVSFLRNLLDCIIRYAAASDFLIRTLEIYLVPYIEQETDRQKRRDMLEEWEKGNIKEWNLSI